MDKKSPAKLTILLTETYFLKFNWGYFDYYESKQVAQFGAGYTLFLLKKYGKEENEATFYAEKFSEAFPKVIDEFEAQPYNTIVNQFNHCFIWRTFGRGLNWLGLVETRETGRRIDGTDKIWIKTTPLFDEFVKVNLNK